MVEQTKSNMLLDNLGVKKVEAPSKCPEKWLKKLLSPKKKLRPKVS
jgi:hypothetical protein